MPSTVDAVAVQSFTLANTETSYMADAVISGLPLSQFNDLEGIGLVRQATPEEVAAAQKAADPIPAEPAPAAPAAA